MENTFENPVIEIVRSCSVVPVPKGKKRFMENRFADAIMIATKGKIVYQFDGRDYESSGSTLLYVPKGLTYKWHCEEEDLSYVLNFDSNMQKQSMALIANRKPGAEAIAKKIVDVLSHPTFGYQNILKKLLYELLADNVDRINDSYPPYINNALSFVSKNIGDSLLTSKDLAKHCSISVVYLNKQFKKYLGVAPKQYIIEARMSLAERTIVSTSQSMVEIGTLCGYSSAARFTKAFKAFHHGVTPLQFRKNNSSI